MYNLCSVHSPYSEEQHLDKNTHILLSGLPVFCFFFPIQTNDLNN